MLKQQRPDISPAAVAKHRSRRLANFPSCRHTPLGGARKSRYLLLPDVLVLLIFFFFFFFVAMACFLLV